MEPRHLPLLPAPLAWLPSESPVWERGAASGVLECVAQADPAHARVCEVCVCSVCSCAQMGPRLTCARMMPRTGATVYKFVLFAVGGWGGGKER